MSRQIEITATFSNENAAQEAYYKLQALRAFEVTGQIDDALLTATVDEATANRAIHLIEQIGGEAITSLN